MHIGVVIVAAGSGKRMGGQVKKQFIELAGKPVLLHTVEIFASMDNWSEIVVVTSEEDIQHVKRLLKDFPQVQVTPGGAERQDSVYCGLTKLIASDFVLIHDGARPFVTQGALLDLVSAMKKTDAAVLAVPVKDTIKQVDDKGIVVATPPRKSLWAVQTPQAFRLPAILHAHEQARADGYTGTDDSSLLERLGQDVTVIAGDYTNIKLTTPEDLAMGETIMRRGNNKGEDQ
ncbi:2-C-methyl-D-erythritol 4-phosphate cytidylyltransferase [Aneurinibacillus sp. Ricciae_BoGa-3]|uniref:2-C-methyl-D-erythritol 4-phosphate cytidylyltransferase n=1 Tax=Aneurinibacillus sp. Ricciae_BoGa-3 TaxID=3022697 RepID=UPI002341C047|nr:2-C-methyl-D-erythritol 4-phosphate cytidylyltransferase [Aneurinibacillus sp. Ricciae_BoGa-3]WCK54668.1 2-C-methyl-D-erythritol 4-phosphate cytidylyltransferase [Aneurinibacillus sp. Ricciae_BoGa-3]